MDTKDIPLASLGGMSTLMTDIGNVMDITAMTNAFVDAYTAVCTEAYMGAYMTALTNGADQAAADAAGNAAIAAAADDAREAVMAAVIDMVYDILNSGNFAGICTLFGLAMVGDGIVSHPSAAGHEVVYNAIVEKYEAKHTAKDETVKNVKYVLGELKGFLEDYVPNVADDVLALWENEGYVTPM